jgi:hypothetical protein
MPPRLRHVRTRREGLSDELATYLLTGEYASAVAAPPSLKLFRFAGAVLRGDYATARDVWREHGAELLPEWVDEHPGRRPFAWWLVVAPEPRQILRGAELVMPPSVLLTESHWRRHFGIPRFVHARPRGYRGLPQVESEAACLARHGLLSSDERRALTAEDFAPAETDPFLIDAEEIERLLEEGGTR